MPAGKLATDVRQILRPQKSKQSVMTAFYELMTPESE
jgi:hypothetical protein